MLLIESSVTRFSGSWLFLPEFSQHLLDIFLHLLPLHNNMSSWKRKIFKTESSSSTGSTPAATSSSENAAPSWRKKLFKFPSTEFIGSTAAGSVLDSDPESSAADMPLERHSLKVAVVGSSGVGKTNILKRFLLDKFDQNAASTVQETTKSRFELPPNIVLDIDFIDCSGASEFCAMRRQCIKNADGIVMVFDLTNNDTFQEVRKIHQEILAFRDVVPVVVIGNKMDLVDEITFDCKYEVVCQLDWGYGFMYTSAKEDIHLAEAFDELLKQAQEKLGFIPAVKRRRKTMCLHTLETLRKEARQLLLIEEKRTRSSSFTEFKRRIRKTMTLSREQPKGSPSHDCTIM